MSNLTVGDDIESALEIIEGNGGTGQWEEESTDTTVPRWSFPRFDGATDDGDMYLSRTGLSPFDTDVETVGAMLSVPRNRCGGVMLLGDPGAGKTALAQAACTHAEREYITLTATPDHTKDALYVRFVGEGKGENGSAFVRSALIEAVATGKTVIVDEFWLFVDGVKPLFYPLMDGGHWLPEANIDGSAVEIHDDFRIIITANPQVRGSSLPEPIGSRFAGTTMTVETSAAMLRDLGIDESIVAAWSALGSANLWRPQVREMRVADYWLNFKIEDADGNQTPVDPGQAVSAFLPEHCPESQREAVRNMVVGFLGGNIRTDGRLVVR